MRLRTKFLIAILLAMGAVTAGGLWLLQRHGQAMLEDRARDQADLVRGYGESCRAYAREVLAPAIHRATPQVVVEGQVPSFVSRGVFQQLRNAHPEYRFKEASTNPLNLANRADDFEAGLIQKFRASPALKELSGYQGAGAKEQFYVARPIAAEARCLSCHGSPSAAPRAIVARYGTTHGYGWKKGEVYAALVVSVPTAGIRASVGVTFAIVALTLLGITVALALTAIFVFRVLVDRRIHRISSAMAKVATTGDYSLRVQDGSSDELGAMMRDFDEMAGRVAAAQSELEAKVERRTEEMKRSEASLRAIFDATEEGIVTLDSTGGILMSNAQAQAIWGYSREELVGQSIKRLIPEQMIDGNPDATMRYRMSGIPGVLGRRIEMEGVRKDGSTFPLDICVSEMRVDASLFYTASARDITERKRLESEKEALLLDLQRRADTDGLTGLCNHRAMQERLPEHMDAALRTGTPLAVAMVDVRDFKLFNDAYGHVIGDHVLRMIAEVLTQVKRPQDVACRYGGDEFVLLMPDTSFEDARARLAEAQRSLDARRFSPHRGGDVVPVRLNFGVAIFPEDASGRLELLARADAEMYMFKRQGHAVPRLRTAPQGPYDEAMETLWSLVTAVDNKDRYTRRHSEEVADYATLLAEALGMSAEDQKTIWKAGMVHDVGKVGIPDVILRKPGKMEPQEWALMKQHPSIGARLVAAFPGLNPTLDAVRHHHEKWNGGGYPDGLAGERIPLIARIMSPADVYSALTTERPYRNGMTPEEALRVISNGAGTDFDPQLVPVFVEAMRAAFGESRKLAA